MDKSRLQQTNNYCRIFIMAALHTIKHIYWFWNGHIISLKLQTKTYIFKHLKWQTLPASTYILKRQHVLNK